MLINKLLPIIIFFFTGFFLKKAGAFRKADGSIFLRAVVYLCIPLIAFSTFSNLELSVEKLYPILTGLVIITGNFLISQLYHRKVSSSKQTSTVYLISGMILNTSLMLPFVYARWGQEGAGIVLLFDIVHVTMVFSFTYWTAMHYGSSREGKVPLKKILRLPPLWGMAAGLLLNLFSIPLPEVLQNMADIAASSLVILMMTALGLFFEFKITRPLLVLGALVQRSLGGFLLALLITVIFGITGDTRTIILLVAAAPVGFNTLVLADLEDLDRGFAAEIVTSATLLAVIFIPVFLLLV